MTEPRVEMIDDDTRPHWVTAGAARPVRVTMWEPSGSEPWPGVMLSHGTGGATKDLAWLAVALRDAGFLVAGVDHHGNSYQDEYLAEGFARTWERALDVSLLIDRLVGEGLADPERIGAAGFSLGGYTVAALLGARINSDVLRAIIGGHIPAPPPPEMPDFLERFTTGRSPEELDAIAEEGGADVRDARVRAGFMMAPAIGQVVTEASLSAIEAPVTVLWGDADDNTPPEANARIYAAAIPHAAGRSVGREAGHFDFHGDFPEGEAVRAAVAREAVEFFARHLAAGRH